jgi:hypothetical protein
VPWSAANDTHIGGGAEWHGSTELAIVKDKEDLISIVGGVGVMMVLDLLAVMLRRQQAHGTERHIVGVWNVQNMTNALVIKDGPLDCANTGSAGGSIEAFDADSSLGGWANEIIKAVGNAGGSSPIN